MNKFIILSLLTFGLEFTLYCQNTTYGTGSGILGARNSYFGYYSGAASNTASTDNSAFGFRALFSNTGDNNTGFGTEALYTNTTGGFNTGFGYRTLYKNVNGAYNTAVGYLALYDNIEGHYNTAIGQRALSGNDTGSYNTATGDQALGGSINSGDANTANGCRALYSNTTGHYNTALGFMALYANTASYNTALGAEALEKNTTGDRNTANGYWALHENTTGDYNTASGFYSMSLNVSGAYNTAAGYYAFANNTTGSRNTADGFRALDNNTTGSFNTAQGANALNYVVVGSYNSALGYDAGPTLTDLTNTTAIGYLSVPTASNQVRIGNTSVTSIGGQVEWTAFSDGRFKKDIKEDVSGLEFIEGLRPVSYTVDREGLNKFLHIKDSSSSQAAAKSIPIRQTGFVAQEVDALIKKSGYIFSGVDAPENENDPYGIRYAEFVVPLVKAVQELSTNGKAQQKQIEAQQKQIESLLSRLGSKDQRDVNANTNAILFQNNPNPFDAETEIKMAVPENIVHATVMLYNLEGKQLKTIQVPDRGDVLVKISASELSAGMYLYSLIADGSVVDTKRMVLTR